MKTLGVDIGGTFTDLYLVDTAAETQTIHKVSTTPADPSDGALTGVSEVCEITPAERPPRGQPRRWTTKAWTSSAAVDTTHR